MENDEEIIEVLDENQKIEDYINEVQLLEEIDESNALDGENNNEGVLNGEEAFRRTLNNKNYYQEKQKEFNKGYEEAKRQKQKKFKKKEGADPDVHQEDGSDVEKKGLLDKTKDSLGLASVKKNVLTNKVNEAKSNIFKVTNPSKALKMFFTNKLKMILLANLPIVIAVAFFLFIIIIVILGIGYDAVSQSHTYSANEHINNEFWWPIGSEEVTRENNRNIASGDPSAMTVTSYYGERTHPISGDPDFHNGIDIAGSPTNYHNIIASRSGTVIVAYNGSVENDGLGYGNYIVIDHGDSMYTLYAHLYQNSLEVQVGDAVVQGEVIGKMGSSGSSTGSHLHFEIRIGGNTSANSVDPLSGDNPYLSISNPRPEPVFDVTTINILKTSLSKTEFVTKMEEYSESMTNSNKKTNFDKNFLPNAELIYNTAVENNLSPEFVVAKAEVEGAYAACGSYNYWGYDTPNETKSCSEAGQFDSLKDGIETIAALWNQYNDPNSEYYNNIMNRYNERRDAGCEAGGYGMPNTIAGIQSIYTWLGTYLIGPEYSNSGNGGCYYIRAFVDQGFMPQTYTEDYYNNVCSSSNTCASSKGGPGCTLTTVCQQSDYTKWGTQKIINIYDNIFDYSQRMYESYSSSSVGKPSNNDADGDGLKDSEDILYSARKYVETEPSYNEDAELDSNGYTKPGAGVCTDVIGHALQNSGYNIKTMVEEDMRNNPEYYVSGGYNYRNVRIMYDYLNNSDLFISLTTDHTKYSEWQAGDIVIFSTYYDEYIELAHIAIISDIKNSDGMPFIIHNGTSPGYEVDRLDSYYAIKGHYRIK